MITPREMLRDYMTVLGVLMQNPEASFEDVVKIAPSAAPASVGANISAEPKFESPAKTDTTRQYTPDDPYRVGANHDSPATTRQYTPEDLDF